MVEIYTHVLSLFSKLASKYFHFFNMKIPWKIFFWVRLWSKKSIDIKKWNKNTAEVVVIERIYQSCKNLKFDPKTQNSTEENYVAFFIILIYPSVTLKWTSQCK